MPALSSSSSITAPKVLPGGGSVSRADLAGDALPPLMPFSQAFHPLLQPVHYGPQDLLACTSGSGNGRVIFIYDMNSVQLVQTLQGHSCAVTAVLWKPPKLSSQQHRLFLMSADQGGSVVLWDVAEGVVISRISVPCGQPVQILSLLSDQHLLVVTQNANSYVFNAHLIDTVVLPPAPLPLRCKEGPRPPVRLASNKLSPSHTSVLLMGDRARIISHLDPAKEARPTARDLIYDSKEGEVTVVDAFFSEAAEEMLYFALPTTVGSYDWKLGMVLDEQLFWTRDGVKFLRIFPSSATSLQLRACTVLPLLYSLTSDQRLTAWYPQRSGKFAAVSADVRGARITSKGVATVSQSDADPTQFAVLFEDGSVAKWGFRARCRRWCLTHYYGCPVQRPICFCRAGGAACSSVCCALESGHVAVVDTRHSVPLKRMNLVYSGGTRIILLCPHKHEDAVWVVSNRVVDGRNHHQVSLLDVRTGEVLRVLRKPSASAELTKAKAASMDATSTYLLLSFWNGTFEVWNTEDGRLLHMHSGLGVASVSWAPGNLRQCLTGVQGSPQLLAIVFSEGTMSLWSVYKDRCVVSRDAVPLLNPNTITGGTVQSAAVGNHLVVFDSTGAGFAVGAKGSRLQSHRLQDVPRSVGAVRCIAGSSPPPLATASFAGLDVFANDSVTAAGAGLSHVPCAAVVFDDFSVGVWSVAAGERLALSTSQITAATLRDVSVAQVLWLEDAVALLCQETGNVLVLDKRLSVVNGSVSARALRRPLQNPSFLLPAQRTYLQTSLELMLLPTSGTGDTACDNSEDAPQAFVGASQSAEDGTGERAAPSSPLVDRIADGHHACRGPFGQLVDDRIQSLQDEMALYQSTMIPREVRRQVDAAARDGDVVRAAFWAARWFGQREKQRLWTLVSLALAAVRGNSLTTQLSRSPASRHISTLPARSEPSSDALTAAQQQQPCEVEEPYLPARDGGGEGRTAFFLADPFSVSTASPQLSRENRLALTELRARTFQGSGHDPAIDDAKARLYVARDFLKMGESAKAVDVLLECSFENAKFDQLSTLAVAAAAGAIVCAGSCGSAARGRHDSTRQSIAPPPPSPQLPATGSTAQTTASALFTLSTKRAAAMLLAAGEVDAAVEKFVLAGEYQEACRALESQGRWHDAVALAKVSPLSTAARRALLQRWAQQCAKHEASATGLAGSRILVSQGLLWEALELLATSSQLTDVAGLLAVVMAKHFTALQADSPPAMEPSRETAETRAKPVGLLLNVLSDYSSLLNSVGSKPGDAHVLRQVASLKRLMHELDDAKCL